MYKVNSKVVRMKLAAEKWTLEQAAQHAGLSVSTLARCANDDCNVNYTTGAKLRMTFGDEVIFDSGVSTKTVTITRDDGTKKDVKITVSDSGHVVSAYGDDEDIRKAFAQYFKQKAE